jgi:hypothetical protein
MNGQQTTVSNDPERDRALYQAAVSKFMQKLLTYIETTDNLPTKPWHSPEFVTHRAEINNIIREIIVKKIPELQQASSDDIAQISEFVENHLYCQAASYLE